jgi:hypothetical protein
MFLYPDFPYPSPDYFNLYNSIFSLPKIKGSTIRVLVENLVVYENFPGPSSDKPYKQVYLVFENVVRSEREIFEEAAPGMDKKPPYKIHDGPFDDSHVKKEDLKVFYLAGHLRNPRGWTEWYIVAPSVRLEEAK